MNRVSVMIVDDESLLREGLRALLQREPFVREIYEAATTQECLDKLLLHRVDLILLDIRLPGPSGLELLTQLRKKEVMPKAIAVTGLEGVEVVINLLKAGVNGVVYKLDGYTEIVMAIRAVMETGSFFPERILRIIQVNASRWDNIPPVVLTYQERELLRALATGLTTKQIAAQLKMTEATTETYRVRLIRKVKAGNTAALLAYAYRNGIL